MLEGQVSALRLARFLCEPSGCMQSRKATTVKLEINIES